MSEQTEEWTYVQKKSQRNKGRRNGFEFNSRSTLKCCKFCKRDLERNKTSGTLMFCKKCDGQEELVHLSINKKKRWELLDKKNYEEYQKDERQKGNLVTTEDDLKVFVKIGKTNVNDEVGEVDVIVNIPESNKRRGEKICRAKEKSIPGYSPLERKSITKKRDIPLDFQIKK